MFWEWERHNLALINQQAHLHREIYYLVVINNNNMVLPLYNFVFLRCHHPTEILCLVFWIVLSLKSCKDCIKDHHYLFKGIFALSN